MAKMTKLAKQYENLLAYIYKHIRLYVLQHACNIENKNFAVYFRQNLESVFLRIHWWSFRWVVRYFCSEACLIGIK